MKISLQVIYNFYKQYFNLIIMKNLFFFTDSQRVQDTIEGGIEKLDMLVENLNVRLARLLAEYTASQAKLKQRIAKLEVK